MEITEQDRDIEGNARRRGGRERFSHGSRRRPSAWEVGDVGQNELPAQPSASLTKFIAIVQIHYQLH